MRYFTLILIVLGLLAINQRKLIVPEESVPRSAEIEIQVHHASAS